MDNIDAGDEYLAILVTGMVAAVRKKYAQIDGFWKVLLLVASVSIIVCCVKYFTGGDFSIPNIISAAIRALWIAALSFAGVNAVSYFTNGKKAGVDE